MRTAASLGGSGEVARPPIVADSTVVSGSLEEEEVVAVTPGGMANGAYFELTLSGMIAMETTDLTRWDQMFLEVETTGDGGTFWSLQGAAQRQHRRFADLHAPARGFRQFYNVALAYVDRRGGTGLPEFWLGIGLKGSKVQQGKLQVPTGYADFGGPYLAYGAYVHPGQIDVATRIYGWREAAKAP